MTSAGIQRAAEQRIPYLLELDAHVLFLSCEPLVEEITLAPFLQQQKINWVICGGYSGSQYRPMQLSWARKLLAECRENHVAFFMKQLGTVYAREHGLHHPKGEDIAEFPDDLQIQEFPQVSPTYQELHA